MCVCMLSLSVMSTLCDPMNYSLPGSSVHGLLQTKILEWVAIPFSRGSSRPKDWTWVSCITDRFFTIWATRKSFSCVRLFVTPWTIACQAPLSMDFSRQECWSVKPFSSPAFLPNPGNESRSSALQVDSLPSEPPGKPRFNHVVYSKLDYCNY